MLTSFQSSTLNLAPSEAAASLAARTPSTSDITLSEHTRITSSAREDASIQITAREREVLHLIAYEHSSKEIASKLFISYETVNSHRKNMMEKLGVKNAAGLVRVAFERRLLLSLITS